MTTSRHAACIDCGHPCMPRSYRCSPCARREVVGYLNEFGEVDRQALAEKARAYAAAKAAQRLADIDADFELGIDPDRIAADQHTSRHALERFCWRHDWPDLAQRFHVNVKNIDRRGTCIDCEVPCQHKSTRCKACWRRVEREGAA